MTEGDRASEVHQAIASGNARGMTEIRLRLRSPTPAIIEACPARPAATRFRGRRRPTPAVSGGVSASCLATSLETAYRKNRQCFSEFLPVSRSLAKSGLWLIRLKAGRRISGEPLDPNLSSMHGQDGGKSALDAALPGVAIALPASVILHRIGSERWPAIPQRAQTTVP